MSSPLLGQKEKAARTAMLRAAVLFSAHPKGISCTHAGAVNEALASPESVAKPVLRSQKVAHLPSTTQSFERKSRINASTLSKLFPPPASISAMAAFVSGTSYQGVRLMGNAFFERALRTNSRSASDGVMPFDAQSLMNASRSEPSRRKVNVAWF